MANTVNSFADALIAAIVNEGQWLTMSMTLAVVTVAIVLFRGYQAEIPARRLTLAAMSLFAALTVGTMAFGHLLAVTTKLWTGTLEGSLPVFYLIGIVLAIPSWWLIIHVRSVIALEGQDGRTLKLNVWLALTLLALGLHNLPLAAPALLNIGYVLHSRRVVGWLLVSAAVAVNVGLFVGSVVFWLSGQSFEQFRELE
jgi:hypothetical protein